MSLIKPRVGELVDRQTILELKLVHCDTGILDKAPEMRPNAKMKTLVKQVLTGDRNKHKNATVFMDEYELIQDYIIKNYLPDILPFDEKTNKYDALYDELSDVNSKIWELEDEARILRIAPDKFVAQAAVRAAQVLFAINDLNDKRMDLIHQIDLLWGIDHQEKMYSKDEVKI